jgi:hypothetical protein
MQNASLMKNDRLITRINQSICNKKRNIFLHEIVAINRLSAVN